MVQIWILYIIIDYHSSDHKYIYLLYHNQFNTNNIKLFKHYEC